MGCISMKRGYMFGVIKDGIQKVYKTNSVREAKNIRSQYVKQENTLISPIYNVNRMRNIELPITLREVTIKNKECKKDGERIWQEL